jgi:hypothetical protein
MGSFSSRASTSLFKELMIMVDTPHFLPRSGRKPQYKKGRRVEG